MIMKTISWEEYYHDDGYEKSFYIKAQGFYDHDQDMPLSIRFKLIQWDKVIEVIDFDVRDTDCYREHIDYYIRALLSGSCNGEVESNMIRVLFLKFIVKSKFVKDIDSEVYETAVKCLKSFNLF